MKALKRGELGVPGKQSVHMGRAEVCRAELSKSQVRQGVSITDSEHGDGIMDFSRGMMSFAFTRCLWKLEN